MVEICLNNKAFRESYQSKKVDIQKIYVTFIKKQDTIKENEIEKFIEWFSNQRFSVKLNK